MVRRIGASFKCDTGIARAHASVASPLCFVHHGPVFQIPHAVHRRTRPRYGITKAEIVAIIAALALLSAMLIPALVPRDREKANLAACRENLRSIGIALAAYTQNNAGKLPVSLTVDGPHPELTGVIIPKYAADPRIFYCPGETLPERSYSEQNFRSGVIGYFYYSASQPSTNEKLSNFLITGITWPRELDATKDKQSWVMSDLWFSGQPTAHAGSRRGVNYLMLDGSVDFISESLRQAFH